MNNMNRDLLVLFNQELMTPQALEHQVNKLHELLFHVERTDNIVHSYELIDMNRSRVSIDPVQIKKHIRQRKFKPFLFLNNRN